MDKPLMEDDSAQYLKEPTPKEWRSFWTLVAVQAQNAFNEKAVQFLLIPLGVWLWGAAGSTLEYALGAIYVLPYILFSPLVGWLADCFCKTRIIQVMSVVQLFVMSCMLFCFYQHDMYAAILWFAIFAIQATILSPAKKGIVKDLLGSRYLSYGSGIIEVSMVFVLLLAQIGVFFLFSCLLDYFTQIQGPLAEDEAGWSAVKLPTWIFISLAVVVAVASLVLPCYPAKQTRRFSWSLFYEHFVQMKYLWRDRQLRLSEIGISYFWCLAGSLFLILIQIAKDMQINHPDIDFSLQCGILMAWLGSGVVVGGSVASQLCKGKNELGLIPLGAIGVTICTLMLSLMDVESLESHIFLSFTGAFGAAYLVPLSAFLQDHCDPANRGNIIAAGNLFDNLMGLLAVALMWVMHAYGARPQGQYFILFLFSAFIMVTSLRLIPQEFIRMIGIWLMNLFYRPRVLHPERFPERGGALIVCNHVTYADALFLTMICPRPVRFVVAEEFMVTRLLGWILEIFNSLPISTKKPRDAIRSAAHGIANGDLICSFPEGQLTRTGCLTPIRRGLESIARRAKAPVIPVYMDGLWGSIFSYYRSRFFTKLPHRIPYPFTVAVGQPIHFRKANSEQVLDIFRELSVECISSESNDSRELLIHLLEDIGKRPLVHCSGNSLTGIQIAGAVINHHAPDNCPRHLVDWLNILIELAKDADVFHRAWINAGQIHRVNALKEGRHALLTTVGLHEPHEPVLAVIWPILTRIPVHLMVSERDRIDPCISQIVGSTYMRHILLQAIPPRQVPFFDFSQGPDISTPNTRWRPGLATSEGIVVSMSMRRSVVQMNDGTIQLGSRPRTMGMLLPGFTVADDKTSITGPALERPFPLPQKLYIDECAFLARLS